MALVLHADADAFFASVVMRRRPDLRSIPFAVTASVYIASANYPARAVGVRGGALAREALTLCPGLVLDEVDRSEVEEASDALFDLFGEIARAVEPGSMEEGFLDVAAADWCAARDAARQIRSRAMAELGLPVSVGVGRTKLMAKLASRRAKPNGLYAIGPDEETHLRESLPLSRAWGVGGRSLRRLTALGVTTLGDIDSVSDTELMQECGSAMARKLREYRDGTDDAAVRPVQLRTVLTAEGAISGFRRPDHQPAELLQTVVARVCRRAARAHLVGTGVSIALRPADGGPVLVRRRIFPDPTADVGVWTSRALDLLTGDSYPPLAGLGVSLTKLGPAGMVPLTLF